MAVVDTYTNAIAEAGKAVYNASIVNGGEPISMVASYTPAAADSDASVYRYFKDVPSNLIPIDLKLMISTGVTEGTVDVGIYKPNGGAAADADCLADGLSTATASRTLDAMGSVAIGDAQKTLAELADLDPSVYPVVDIAVLANDALGAQATALKGIFLKK